MNHRQLAHYLADNLIDIKKLKSSNSDDFGVAVDFFVKLLNENNKTN